MATIVHKMRARMHIQWQQPQSLTRTEHKQINFLKQNRTKQKQQQQPNELKGNQNGIDVHCSSYRKYMKWTHIFISLFTISLCVD